MKFYYAPLESVTGYPLRNAHHDFFPGVDKYFTPFVSANESGKFTGREGRDIARENNGSLPIVPQLLSKNAEHILWAVNTMYSLGYREINLNLGCPSGTVVAKGKGAGMLRDPEELDSFFFELFERLEKAGYHASRNEEIWRSDAFDSEKNIVFCEDNPAKIQKNVAISVKTRLGIRDAKEAEELIHVFNRYPISELTVHARVLKDMYRNPVNWDGFSSFYENSKIPLVYNGDINSVDDYRKLLSEFPDLPAVMLGRGLVGNPALIREICGGEAINREELRQYLERLLDNYKKEISGERNILFKMKEEWAYLKRLFPEGEKFQKDIRKSSSLIEYKAAVRRLFSESRLLSEIS